MSTIDVCCDGEVATLTLNPTVDAVDGLADRRGGAADHQASERQPRNAS